MIDIKKFDKEYSTQYVAEMKYLQAHDILYSFVKTINGIKTYKYKKTKKLFDTLANFYAEIKWYHINEGIDNMGNKYGDFKLNIGDRIDTFERHLIIIDRKYVDKIAHKNGKPYNLYQKFYKYKCLNCGNEDWIIEDALTGKQHCGCNACCHPPRKLVVRINDITTTTT